MEEENCVLQATSVKLESRPQFLVLQVLTTLTVKVKILMPARPVQKATTVLTMEAQPSQCVRMDSIVRQDSLLQLSTWSLALTLQPQPQSLLVNQHQDQKVKSAQLVTNVRMESRKLAHLAHTRI